jgi:hypothetical protein
MPQDDQRHLWACSSGDCSILPHYGSKQGKKNSVSLVKLKIVPTSEAGIRRGSASEIGENREDFWHEHFVKSFKWTFLFKLSFTAPPLAQSILETGPTKDSGCDVLRKAGRSIWRSISTCDIYYSCSDRERWASLALGKFWNPNPNEREGERSW